MRRCISFTFPDTVEGNLGKKPDDLQTKDAAAREVEASEESIAGLLEVSFMFVCCCCFCCFFGGAGGGVVSHIDSHFEPLILELFL